MGTTSGARVTPTELHSEWETETMSKDVDGLSNGYWYVLVAVLSIIAVSISIVAA